MGTFCERRDSTSYGALSALDQWIKHILKDQYGHISREPVPDDLLRLVDDLTPEH